MPALPEAEEYPLAGEVIDVEPIRPPWPGAEPLGARIGTAWFWAGAILPIVLRCAARLSYGLPWVAFKFAVALMRRYRRWASSSA